MMDEFEKELSDAIGQRNMAWHQERLGRFTSSRFDDMMKVGRASTKRRRERITNSLACGDISQEYYDIELQEIESIEYESRFGDACKTYVYEKIAEIMTQSVHLTGGSAATEWGTDQEANAVRHYEKVTSRRVQPIGFLKYNEMAGGSPDGKIIGENGIIEIKCPFNPANHIRTLLTETVPKSYFYQIHGNIMVTGSDFCDYVSYDPRMQDEEYKIMIIRVDRDEEIIKAIQERVQEVADYMRLLMNRGQVNSG